MLPPYQHSWDSFIIRHDIPLLEDPHEETSYNAVYHAPCYLLMFNANREYQCNEGESAEQALTIESSGISMIASIGFDSAMDEEAQAGIKAKAETDDIMQYLAYGGNGSYEQKHDVYVTTYVSIYRIYRTFGISFILVCK